MPQSDNTEGLRYDKVILTPDADMDCPHIRNLMITSFLKFFVRLFLLPEHLVRWIIVGRPSNSDSSVCQED